MSVAREWAFTLCVCCVGISLTALMMPSSSLKKLLNFICGVFLLLVIAYPLKTIGLSDSLNTNITEGASMDEIQYEAQRIVENILMKTASNNVASAVEGQLSAMEVKGGKAGIIMGVNAKGEPDILSLSVRLDNSYKERKDEIRQKLFDTTGLEARILFEGDSAYE